MNLESEYECIKGFLKSELARLGKSKVVIGLSGGVDSTVTAYLAVRALGRNNVSALILPEKHSDKRNINDAVAIAESLGIKYEVIDITKTLESMGVYRIINYSPATLKRYYGLLKKLFPAFSPYVFFQKLRYSKSRLFAKLSPWRAFVFSKIRTRMIILHQNAVINGALVLGTTDRTEWLLGLYDKYGDSACDIYLIKHLFNTEVRELGIYLGVSESLISKEGNPDVFPGFAENSLIGVKSVLIDDILKGLIKGVPDKDLAHSLSVSLDIIKNLKSLISCAEIDKSLPRSL